MSRELGMWSGSDEPQTTVVVEDEADCVEAIEQLIRNGDESPMFGLDCESDESQKISLMQLCTPTGYCVLIRLCFLPRIPQILRSLLIDRRVVKVGVGAPRDATRLNLEHDIETDGILDLRFPAVLADYQPQNLADMYKEVLGKTLIRKKYPGSWECPDLSPRQIKYAAQGAFAGIQIYKNFIERRLQLSELTEYYNRTFDPYWHNQLRRTHSDVNSYRPRLYQTPQISMPAPEEENNTWKTAFGVVGGAVAIAAAAGLVHNFFRDSNDASQRPNTEAEHFECHIVEEEDECLEAVKQLRKHCNESRVLGFDCEANQNDKISMLQLCSHEGYCVLIRLRNSLKIPALLRELLMDRSVVKVGVGAPQDAVRMRRDHALAVESVLDLRFLAVLTGYKPQKLPDMYYEVTGNKLIDKKHYGSWSADNLRGRHIKYAAQGAYAGVEIFRTLMKKMSNPSTLTEYYGKTYNPNQHDALKPQDDECVMQ